MTTQLNPEGIMQSEISQAEKDTSCLLAPICGNNYSKVELTEADRTTVVDRGWRLAGGAEGEVGKMAHISSYEMSTVRGSSV